MNRLLLFFTLLLVNTAYSRIQSAELIYNKTKVCNGNEISIILKVITKNGKVFFSNSQTKYDFSQFSVKVSDNVKILSSDPNRLRIYINEYNESDFISIELQHYYGTQKKFNFKIPVVPYQGSVKNIKLTSNNVQVKANSIINLGISCQIASNDIINVTKNSKLSYDMFKITVLEGGYLLNNNGDIQIGNYNYCNPNLKVKVELRRDTSIFTISNFNIINDFKQKTYLSFKNLKKGDLNIKLDVFFDSCLKDSLLKVEILDDFDSTLAVYQLKLGVEILIINAGGKNGLNGIDGKNGNPKKRSIDGGNGTDGTDGTDGKDVYIYFAKNVEKYKSKVIINNKGGRGGRYGKGGRGAKTDVRSKETYRTVYGSNGIQGRDGRDGRDGTIHYILVSE